ncbi:surface antigen BspA-like [Trichomonas vaginalis G3]|uniref:Surface antigen BspA-like n=1 Tax=Trichomonas vaginalis (strain ATCC PRA-98 / G3) TaxID=412133 RepID=A2FKR9_TRIV3|nr:surface antigen BspA-like [Trichomonas vaginalis G3]|eukprot:XP_001307423.1 surface antigen BspA-like [Trichomonas vaginalis G3]
MCVPTLSGEYVVPNYVTSIFEGCFRAVKLTNIVLHENISSIKSWAFAGTKITSIKIPDKVITISTNAFRSCSNLRYVNLSNKTTILESFCFADCPNLLFMDFPATLSNIGQSAFVGCKNLRIDTSKNSNFEYVDQMLFTNEKKTLSAYFGTETRDLIIPDGLTSIDSYVFNNMKIRYVTFNGQTLTTINERAFESSTIEKIDIPSSVTYIEPKCFYGCNNLSTVNFISNNALTVIPNNCFYNCQKLSNIKLPPSIQTIGENAFWSCFSLGDIGMSSTQISKINEFAFQNSGLTTFVNTKNSVTINFGSFMNCGIETVSFITESVP